MSVEDIAIRIIGFSLIVMVIAVVIITVHDVTQNKIIECKEEESVPFRYVGTGGLGGGKEKVVTTMDNRDGFMKMCVKGYNMNGRLIKKKIPK